MARELEDVLKYIEWQAHTDAITAKTEQTFSDLGFEVRVWNVKSKDGAWWVVEGDGIPMNLYPQEAYYFSADEAYSFHMGIMSRLLVDSARDPDSILDSVAYGGTRFLAVRRKLEVAAEVLSQAEEPEHFQAIGLDCREALIALGKEILVTGDLPKDVEFPKLADFKNRSRLAIERLIPGGENSELRSHSRKVCDAAWDFSSSLTHSDSRSAQDAAICLTLVGAVVSLFENLIEKVDGFSPDVNCPVCKSRRLQFSETEITDPPTVRVQCVHCGWEEYAQLVEESTE